MEFKKSSTILKELKHHLPLTLTVSLLAGVSVALIVLLNLRLTEFFPNAFEIIHPAHVLVSAAATAAIFHKYKKSILQSIIIGVTGAILIGTISDALLPWIAGNLFSLNTTLHLPIIENPILIITTAIAGTYIGIYLGLFKLNHSLHVFFSVFASLFYLLAFSSNINIWIILGSSFVVFLVVYIPCCVSDIVFPILFIKKPCKDCGHWHS
jgi:hypothetical protein